MIAYEIFIQARESLANLIYSLVVELYQKNNNGENPNFEDDEEWVLTKTEVDGLPKISIEVEDKYLDCNDTFVEFSDIYEIRATLDGNVFVALEDDEIEWSDLTTEELYKIAKALETTNNK